mgnify:CR=1 FL=1
MTAIPPPPNAPPTPVIPAATVSRTSAIVGVVVAALIGLGVGAAAGGDTETEVRTVTEQVDVPTVPTACKEAVGYAANAMQGYIRWQETAREVFSLAGDGIGAVTDLDYARVNEITGELSAKKDLLTSIESEITDASASYINAGETCTDSE